MYHLGPGRGRVKNAGPGPRSSFRYVKRQNSTAITGVESPKNATHQILVCNVYDKQEEYVRVLLNEETELAKKLKYKACGYFNTTLHGKDEIDVIMDAEIGGTFQVTDLPAPESVLLLIVERRLNSTLMAFQSYVFPVNHENFAQVAVIDAYKGRQASASLTLEDHVVIRRDGHPLKYQRVRLEELAFNKVYSIEAGDYDADIAFEDVTTKQRKHTLKKLLRLQKGRDYVIMRTGNDEDQELVAYPNILNSNAATLSLLAVIGLLFF